MVAKSPTLKASFMIAPPSDLTFVAISAALGTRRYGSQPALGPAPSGEAKYPPMVVPSEAAIMVYAPSGIGTLLVLQPNSSPKNPCAFGASFETYSNQTKRPVLV